MKIILKLPYDANSINLYNRMKNTLRDKTNWGGNFFNTTDENIYQEVYFNVFFN